jgi:hypothetical protein
MAGLLNSLPYLVTSVAGFDLYELEETEDGSVVITTVTNDGFGDMNNHGLRVFTETDDYLVIGTANPFYGTQIWRTEGNPDDTKPDPTPTPDPDPTPTPKPIVRPTVSNKQPARDICLQDKTCLLAAFDDVDPAAWYHDGVHYCLVEGLMLGTTNRTFGPGATMTRAMIWTVLARMEGVDTSAGSTWYEAGQLWAVRNHISDGSNPNGAITREQLITMLWRYMGEPSSAQSSLTGFVDTNNIQDYAANAMSWGVSKGILVGDNGALQPQGNATRAQVATMLYRFCENVK